MTEIGSRLNGQEKFGIRQFSTYLMLLALTICACISLIQYPVWVVIPTVFIVALPVVIPLAVFGNVRQAHRLSYLNDESWIKWIFSGPTFRLIGALFAGLLVVAIALPLLAMGDIFSWIILLLGAVSFWTTYFVLKNRISAHVSEAFRIIQPIWTSLRLSVAILVAVAAIFVVISPADNSQIWNEPASVPSALVTEWITIASFVEHVQSYSLTQVRGQPIWQGLIAIILGPAAVASLGASLAACAVLPKSEQSRILGRASLATPAPRVARSTIGLASGMFTILVLFLVAPVLAALETHVRQAPIDQRAAFRLNDAATKVRVVVEMIGNHAYLPGTIEAVQGVARESLKQVAEDANSRVRSEIELTADNMINNVDIFLDEYYSLTNEYRRIALMITGDLAEELEASLLRTLSLGLPTENIDRLLSNNASEQYLSATEQTLLEEIELLLNSGRVYPTEETVLVVSDECSATPCLDFENAFYELHRSTNDRLTQSGLLGAGGGIVAALVVKKIIAKGTLKFATKALTKAVASKTVAGGGGSALGALIGGTIGSVIPGAGTAAGAAIGGVVGGVLVGVGVDAILLELEESFEREQFKAQIVQAIEGWKQEALAVLEL